jgi:hypothetical protein
MSKDKIKAAALAKQIYDDGRTINKETSRQMVNRWAMEASIKNKYGTNNVAGYEGCVNVMNSRSNR